MASYPAIKNLATKSSKTRMVQKTIRQKILEALAESHMTRELAYKNSEFANKIEKRVIVYSRA